MITIHLQYSGTVRLLIGKKEEDFSFVQNPTLEELINTIRQQYGQEVVEEVLHQMILLQSSGITKQLKWSQDQRMEVEGGSLIKIISLVTGG